MNLHRLDLVSLALFTYVCRTGSISQGAALAHLAVGAASKRITDLEAAVGSALLERHSRGARPTAAGQALLGHAQRILGAVPPGALTTLPAASRMTVKPLGFCGSLLISGVLDQQTPA